MSKVAKKSNARQRVIETAEQLFYAHGVRAVGVDRIIAEAGVAKMTLYNHFKSKDDLILAVLEYRESVFSAFMDDKIAKYVKKGKGRLAAFLATLKDWFKSPGFRGCSFINASVELADRSHPASQFSKEHKARFRAMVEEMVAEEVGEQAKELAPIIALLVEGAIVTAVMNGEPKSAEVALDGARALLQKDI